MRGIGWEGVIAIAHLWFMSKTETLAVCYLD